MKRLLIIMIVVIFMIIPPVVMADRNGEASKIHLFILSGQSNMKRLHDESFTLSITKAFSCDKIIVVKDAENGQPISRWYKKWKPVPGQGPKTTGDLYDRLMTKVKETLSGKTPNTITFIWMQGESDTGKRRGKVYAASLKGLIDQLRKDLKFKDLNFVIGRLSDFDIGNKTFSHWTMVRQAQVEVAESDFLGAWVDTDDLNGPNNDLHYTNEGCKVLAERFAAKAIDLISQNAGKPPNSMAQTILWLKTRLR